MPILECITTEEGAVTKVGDILEAKKLGQRKPGVMVYDLYNDLGLKAGRVYWHESGEIHRCCFTNVKFREVK